MTDLEKELHAALTNFMRASASRDTNQVSAALTKVLELEHQLGSDVHPMLQHYLERRSYQKALDFLDSGRPETETPQCGH